MRWWRGCIAARPARLPIAARRPRAGLAAAGGKAKAGLSKARLPQFGEDLVALTTKQIERGRCVDHEVEVQAFAARRHLKPEGAEFDGGKGDRDCTRAADIGQDLPDDEIGQRRRKVRRLWEGGFADIRFAARLGTICQRQVRGDGVGRNMGCGFHGQGARVQGRGFGERFVRADDGWPILPFGRRPQVGSGRGRIGGRICRRPRGQGLLHRWRGIAIRWRCGVPYRKGRGCLNGLHRRRW